MFVCDIHKDVHAGVMLVRIGGLVGNIVPHVVHARRPIVTVHSNAH